MNTKHILLLAVSLLVTTASSSVQQTKTATPATTETPAKLHSKKENQPLDLPAPKVPLSAERNHEDKPHLQPEDGKHHSFHFHRISGLRRRRELKKLACKLIVVLGHLCCLVYCLLHAFH